jgi:hypothetical protein
MGSSIGRSASTTRFTHSSWWDDTDKIITLSIHSRRVSAVFGVHHYIVCEGIDDLLRVAEWGTTGNNYDALDIYATARV